jgi:hypothetical protein
MSDIDHARRLFGESGLAFPSIPEQLSGRLKQRDTWLFSTRDIEVSPYSLDLYVREVLETDVEGYVVLAHSGRAVDS